MERQRARGLLEEWGLSGKSARDAIDKLVNWWGTGDEHDLEPTVLVFNIQGDIEEVGAAHFLEQFGVDLDRLLMDVEF